jgi:murein L,D-transpeptidase YcbB/YkuD
MRKKTALLLAGLLLGAGAAAGPAAAVQAEAPVTPAAASCAGATKLNHQGSYFYYRPSTAPASGNYNCILGLGSSGSGVVALQQAANLCYGQGLTVDGEYGPRTRDAVRNIQRFHGISADGVFGPVTNLHMAYPKYRESNGAYAGCWF